MRPVRMTYEGAMHHVMCRGKEGIKILFGNRNKLSFLELLKECTSRYRVRLFGYCLLDNEYHLVMENSSGRMGDCLKQLNGQYGMYFRKSIGHKGPVFRDRYKSILVQDGSYLKLALGYILLLPVREQIVEKADEYLWSSTSEYFVKKKSDLLDNHYVSGLFGGKKEFRHYLRTLQPKMGKKLPFLKTKRFGRVLGEESILEEAFEKNNVRIEFEKARKNKNRPPAFEKHYERVEEIVDEFEKTNDVKIDELDTHKYEGKRLRTQLLVQLKDRGGLTYPEIIRMPLFKELKQGSLGRLYGRGKERMQAEK